MSDEFCICGHKRRDHIYEEGACRPGFVCPSECPRYVLETDLAKALREFNAEIEVLKKDAIGKLKIDKIIQSMNKFFASFKK